jgi:hypothetical protein
LRIVLFFVFVVRFEFLVVGVFFTLPFFLIAFFFFFFFFVFVVGEFITESGGKVRNGSEGVFFGGWR